jgi:hypothetical protein
MPKQRKAKQKNIYLFPASATVIIASLILVILGYVSDSPALAAAKPNTFRDANITLKYPAWKAVDLSENPYKDNLPVAVSNGDCAFMVVTAAMPPGSTLKDFEAGAYDEQSKVAGTKFLTKTMTADFFTFDVTAPADGGASMRQYAYGVMGANHSVYQATFLGPAKTFLKSCKPSIQATVKSITLLTPPSEKADAQKFSEYFKSFTLGKLALNKKVGPKNVPVKTNVFTSKDQFCVVADIKQDIPAGALASSVYGIETAQDVIEKSASTEFTRAGKTMSCGGPSKFTPGRYEMKVYIDDVLAGVYPFTIKK